MAYLPGAPDPCLINPQRPNSYISPPAQVDIEQHKSLEARIGCAKSYREDFECHQDLAFFVDTMDNAFNHAFASWPFRFWVLARPEPGAGLVVQFKAMPQDSAYRIDDLSEFLRDGPSAPGSGG